MIDISTELTENEQKVVNWLMDTGWYAEEGFSDVEVSDIATNLDVDIKSMKGYVGSLVKKNYVWVSEREGEVPPLVYADHKKFEYNWDLGKYELK